MSRYVDEHRGRFGVEPICRTLGVSASAYYQRKTGERSARAVQDERLIEVIRVNHKKNFEAYGYRRTWKALLRAGEQVPRCRVQRLMAAHGIQGAKRRGKPWRTTKPDLSAQRPRDLVCRDFTARALTAPISANGSVVVTSPKAADGLRTRRFSPASVDLVVKGSITSETARSSQRCPLRPRHRQAVDETPACGLSDE